LKVGVRTKLKVGPATLGIQSTEVTPIPLLLRPEASSHSTEIRVLMKVLVHRRLTDDGLVLQNLPRVEIPSQMYELSHSDFRWEVREHTMSDSGSGREQGAKGQSDSQEFDHFEVL